MKYMILTSCTGKKAAVPTTAREMYRGEQHSRLLRGMLNHPVEIDLWILSARYGIVPSEQVIAPYNYTFTGMNKNELRWAAKSLNLPQKFRELMACPYDFGLLLLGEKYLRACDFDAEVRLGGPTLLPCGLSTKLPKIQNLKPLRFSIADTRRFSCGMVGLKGEVARRLLRKLAVKRLTIERIMNPKTDVLQLLTSG